MDKNGRDWGWGVGKSVGSVLGMNIREHWQAGGMERVNGRGHVSDKRIMLATRCAPAMQTFMVWVGEWVGGMGVSGWEENKTKKIHMKSWKACAIRTSAVTVSPKNKFRLISRMHLSFCLCLFVCLSISWFFLPVKSMFDGTFFALDHEMLRKKFWFFHDMMLPRKKSAYEIEYAGWLWWRRDISVFQSCLVG